MGNEKSIITHSLQNLKYKQNETTTSTSTMVATNIAKETGKKVQQNKKEVKQAETNSAKKSGRKQETTIPEELSDKKGTAKVIPKLNLGELISDSEPELPSGRISMV